MIGGPSTDRSSLRGTAPFTVRLRISRTPPPHYNPASPPLSSGYPDPRVLIPSHMLQPGKSV